MPPQTAKKSAKKVKAKLYFSITDVGEVTDLKPHILRYWETEFPFLRPKRNRAGNRAYRQKDIEMILLIKNLLYDEGYTIEGAKQKIRSMRKIRDNIADLPESLTDETKLVLQTIIDELMEIRELLD